MSAYEGSKMQEENERRKSYIEITQAKVKERVQRIIKEIDNEETIKNKNTMKTGIELIAEERQEQIEKHGRTIKKDIAENKDGQLKHAARKLLSNATERETGCPKGWDQNIYNKMADKSMIDRLVIAGALIAAEIDRLRSE